MTPDDESRKDQRDRQGRKGLNEDPSRARRSEGPSSAGGAEGAGGAGGSPGARDEGPTHLDEVLGVLLHESTLWPLLIVIVLSLGALGAALVVLGLVDRNPFAGVALLLVLGMTADLFWRSRSRRGLRHLARGVGMIWLAAFALAGLAVWLGIA